MNREDGKKWLFGQYLVVHQADSYVESSRGKKVTCPTKLSYNNDYLLQDAKSIQTKPMWL